jgi:hypothetical protein
VFSLLYSANHTNLGKFGIQSVLQACRCGEYVFSCENATHIRGTRTCSPSACAVESYAYENATCGGAVTTYNDITGGVSDQYLTPLVNVTSVYGTENIFANWVSIFLTPIFLSTFLMLGISGYIAMKIKGDNVGTTFGISCLLITILYAVFGIYPLWLVIIFIIGVAFLVAKNIGLVGG